MATWYVDEGLAALDTEWKKVHPGAVVFHIGDVNHDADPDVSQHAPDTGGPEPGDDKGEVDASDFMPGKGGVTMEHLRDLRDGLLESRDKRILYMIFKDKIVSSVVAPWVIRDYGGKYHTHLHLSVNDKYDDNRSDWRWEAMANRNYTFTTLDVRLPNLIVGDEDYDTSYISRVQRILKVDDDGVYGPNTAVALKKWMTGKPASTSNGTRIGEPEWRSLYALAEA